MSGGLLRVAAVISARWAVQWIATAVWPEADRSAQPEAFSRSLCANAVDAAHEIATTRLCVALVSIMVTITAHEENWHSKWAVIVVAILVSMAVALFAHVPSLFRKTSTRSALASALRGSSPS